MSKFFKESFIIAFLTSFIFVTGQATYQGYYSGYGVEPSVVGLPLHDMMYIGFFTVFDGVFSISYFLFILAVFYIIFSKERDNFTETDAYKNMNKWKLILYFYKFTGGVKGYFSNHILANIFLIFFISLIIFIFTLSYYERTAKIRAISNYSIILDKSRYHEIAREKLLNVKFENDYGDVYLIGCGTYKCAGVDLNSDRVVYFNPEQASHELPKIHR